MGLLETPSFACSNLRRSRVGERTVSGELVAADPVRLCFLHYHVFQLAWTLRQTERSWCCQGTSLVYG